MARSVTRPFERFGRLEMPSASTWRQVAVLAVLIAVTMAARLVTWDPVADGAHGRYVKTVVFGGCAAAAVWALIRVQVAPASRLPLAAAAAVLLAGDAVHYVRLANPITHGKPVVAFTADLADPAAAPAQWKVTATGGGAVRFENGAMLLESPPNGPAYAQARLDASPADAANWWLPLALLEGGRAQRLAWRAGVRRTGDFYVVLNVDRLLIQVVSYGVHVTYPDERNESKGNEINHPVGTDGQTHDWELLEDARQIGLRIDGKQVWSAAPRQPLDKVQLGESRTDALHGGAMRVEAVSYTSALARP